MIRLGNLLHGREGEGVESVTFLWQLTFRFADSKGCFRKLSRRKVKELSSREETEKESSIKEAANFQSSLDFCRKPRSGRRRNALGALSSYCELLSRENPRKKPLCTPFFPFKAGFTQPSSRRQATVRQNFPQWVLIGDIDTMSVPGHPSVPI